MNTDECKTDFFSYPCSSVFICGYILSASPQANFEKRWLSGMFYGEGANFGDFNKDGKLDVVSGPYIYDGPEFTMKREFMPREAVRPAALLQELLRLHPRLQQRRLDDILIIGFPGERRIWYENPGEKQGRQATGSGTSCSNVIDNESPMLADLVGDDTPELVCMSGGHAGYATPDSSDPTKPWTFHPDHAQERTSSASPTAWASATSTATASSTSSRRTAGGNSPHRSSGDPRPWKKHDVRVRRPTAARRCTPTTSTATATTTSSPASTPTATAWRGTSRRQGRRQDRRSSSTSSSAPRPRRRLNGVQFSQLHAVELVDMDGDGLKDILTGKRYWAHGPTGDPEPEARRRSSTGSSSRATRASGKAKFEPKQIDDNCGVGTQVAAADVNGDKKPDVVVGNKRGTMLFLSK